MEWNGRKSHKRVMNELNNSEQFKYFTSCKTDYSLDSNKKK